MGDLRFHLVTKTPFQKLCFGDFVVEFRQVFGGRSPAVEIALDVQRIDQNDFLQA